jgi:fucose 4-O-acetylase-like acetyltransferase
LYYSNADILIKKTMLDFFAKIKNLLNIDKLKTNKRNHHIDALKGVAIILVVLGHSVQVNDANFDNNLLFRIIYSFHMPMFMFLSGYILLAQLGHSFLGYLKKNAIRLLVPFLVWYFVSYIIICFQKDVSLATYFLDLARSPGRGLWFLWILFLNSTLLFCALKLACYKNWQNRENYFVIAAILLSMACSADFFALADVKQYFPYYAAGFFVRKYRDTLKDRKKIIYAVSMISFPILSLAWKRNDFPMFYPALLQVLDNQHIARLLVSIYKYAVSFTGIAFCSFVLERIKQTGLSCFLGWLGMFTLDIYVCHSYFMIGFGDGALRYFTATAASLLISLSLSLLLMRRFKITRLLLLGQSR